MTRDDLLKIICPNACINDCKFIGCSQCNVKLNEWLDKYDKHVIEQYKADTNLKDTIREIHDNVANEMYCKGIDDFVHKCDKHCGFYTGDNKNLTREDILFIANELKEQDK